MAIEKTRWNASWAALLVAAAVFALAGNARALDGYRDRRGVFFGIGGGGGAAFQGGDAGGSVLLDLQLGGGFAQDKTLALDTDVVFQLMGDYYNLMINPGPEFSFHFENGFYLRAGVAAALVYFSPDNGGNEFNIGFNGMLGGGWEVFMNSNVAVDVGLEGDYILLADDDSINVGFIINMRYY